ncbi:DUF6585 family protein [Thermogemmatispora sp.]|uniref:DUF6585 family protein n=3 Tax=Thermogemmatispora sp. TaxID=1968838 RepID=UPI002ACBF4D4|nr:DUF6585 family protein [Thermogemmatispora sp.]
MTRVQGLWPPTVEGEPMPVAVERLILQYSLGTPLRVYKLTLLELSGVVEALWLGAMLLLVCFFFCLVETASGVPFLTALVSCLALCRQPEILIICCLGWLWVMVPRWACLGWRVYVCLDGFVCQQGQRLMALRWDQIEALWYREEIKGIVTGSSGEMEFVRKESYRLQSIDGRWLNLKGPLLKKPELISLINRQICAHRLPGAIAALQAGETLVFGEMRVNQAGLSKGRKFVPWQEIKDVTVDGCRLGIQRLPKQGLRQKDVYWKVSAMVNPGLFLALKDAVLAARLAEGDTKAAPSFSIGPTLEGVEPFLSRQVCLASDRLPPR